MAFDKSALLAGLEQDGVDQSKVQTGGGEYTPPAKGPVRLRLFSYVELGKQERTVKTPGKPDQKKLQDMVRLGFELSGPNHPPREDGTPHVMFIEEVLSFNEKANFAKLFAKLNHSGKAKHVVALLGEAFRGTIYHSETKGVDGKPRIWANLRAKGEAYDIKPTTYVDEETGEVKSVSVAPLVNKEQCFIWSRPDLEQWASIYIEGEYPARTNEAGEIVKAASSKNVIQAKIMRAKNFPGSPIETLLKTNGKGLDIPNAEVEETEGEDETLNVPGQKPEQPASTPTGGDADAALAAALGG